MTEENSIFFDKNTDLQETINLLSPHSTIQIPEGTIYTNLQIKKSIKLIGQGEVMLNGNTKGFVILVNGDDIQVEIENIQITNGAMDFGAGVCSIGKNHLVIKNCQIYSNKAYFSGGGIHIRNGKLEIFNSFIIDNEAKGGGGISLANSSEAYLENCKVSSNQAESGGGIYIRDAAYMKIVQSIIEDNTLVNPTDLGSAIYGSGTMTQNPKINVENCLISHKNGNPVIANGIYPAIWEVKGCTLPKASQIILTDQEENKFEEYPHKSGEGFFLDQTGLDAVNAFNAIASNGGKINPFLRKELEKLQILGYTTHQEPYEIAPLDELSEVVSILNKPALNLILISRDYPNRSSSQKKEVKIHIRKEKMVKHIKSEINNHYVQLQNTDKLLGIIQTFLRLDRSLGSFEPPINFQLSMESATRLYTELPIRSENMDLVALNEIEINFISEIESSFLIGVELKGEDPFPIAGGVFTPSGSALLSFKSMKEDKVNIVSLSLHEIQNNVNRIVMNTLNTFNIS